MPEEAADVSYPKVTVRQPGGLRKVCNADQTAPPPCDCFFCDVNGHPQTIFAYFTHFNNADVLCGFFNGDNTTAHPAPFNGYPCQFESASAGTDDLGNYTAACHYQSDLITNIASGGVPPCRSDIKAINGFRIHIFLGYQSLPGGDGIYVACQIWGDPTNELFYSWKVKNLERWLTAGQVDCAGIGANPKKTLAYAISQAILTDYAGNWHWEYEYSAAYGSDGAGPGCYLCFSDAGSTPASMPDATVGLTFQGHSRTAPPCCCGGPVNRTHRDFPNCYFLCFEAGSACALCGVGFMLCPTDTPTDPPSWSGNGNLPDGTPVTATLTGNDSLSVQCGNNAPQNVDLSGGNQLTGTFDPGADCECTSGEPVTVKVSKTGPILCPCNREGGTCFDLIENMYIPETVLIAIPQVGVNPASFAGMGPNAAGFAQTCQNLSGTFALDLNGGVPGIVPCQNTACSPLGCDVSSSGLGAAWGLSEQIIFDGPKDCHYLDGSIYIKNLRQWIACMGFSLCCDGFCALNICQRFDADETIGGGGNVQNEYGCANIGSCGTVFGCAATQIPLDQIQPGATFSLPWTADGNGTCNWIGSAATVEFL